MQALWIAAVLSGLAWGEVASVCVPSSEFPYDRIMEMVPLSRDRTPNGVVTLHYADGGGYFVVISFPDGLTCVTIRHGPVDGAP